MENAKVYKVEITETLKRFVYLVADNEEQAKAIAETRYNQEEIVLDYSDLWNVNIKASEYATINDFKKVQASIDNLNKK